MERRPKSSRRPRGAYTALDLKVEIPLLKIEVAVDREGKIAAVRCRAALDVGVEAVFEGTAPGYRLEKTAGAGAEKTATDAEATLDEHKGEEGGWVERLLEEVRREFSGLLVHVGVEDGDVYVKKTASMDQGQFRKYLETCKRLGFRFDRGSSRWRSYSHLQRYKPASTLTQPPQAGHLLLPPSPHASSLWTGWWRLWLSICAATEALGFSASRLA